MNVKPGDLAIVVKSQGRNLGKIIEVIGPMGENPFYDGVWWNGGDGFCWMVKGKLESKSGRLKECAPMPDAFLRPVSGLPDTEAIKDEKPLVLLIECDR